MRNKKCLGCGVVLQNENVLNLGYTPNIENNYCMRCFKAKNYGVHENITNDKEEYLKILKSINRGKDLVLYIVDILNIPEDLNQIKEYLNQEIILVLNKRDVLPKSIKDEKIISYIKERYDFKDYLIVSSLNNYNMDLLYKKILKYKNSNNVYLIGETNAGKSSLINKIISNYSDKEPILTTSNMPETTLDKIKIEINDKLTLIDTPGLVEYSNIIYQVNSKYYKLLNSKKEIKPRTYQINSNQCLIIGDFLRIDYLEGDKNSFTLYLPNKIPVKRMNIRHDNLKDLAYKEYDIKYHEDLVIYGLGFVKIVMQGKVGIYLKNNIKTYIRKNLI